MLYITGDTHGNQYKWMEQIDPVLQPGDTIFVAGDFGVGFWQGRYWSEDRFYDWLGAQPYTVAFCDGNHCNFDKLNAYPLARWNGGQVHRLRQNLLHLMRGEVYRLDGQTLFVMGGGYSLDRFRRREGISWWPQEMPSAAEYARARTNLAKCNHQVDVILTHTAPAETVYALSTRPSIGIQNNVTEEWELTSFLDFVQHTVRYDRWFFGHFHVDFALWRRQYALFNTIREFNTGRVVRQWPPYEG